MSAMTDATNPAVFDVTIICTTDDHQAEFWMSKLNMSVEGQQFPLVLAVSEDWGGSELGMVLEPFKAGRKVAIMPLPNTKSILSAWFSALGLPR